MKTVLITFAVKAIMNEHPTSAGRHFLKYCKEIKENLLEVNYESDNIKVTGVIGNTLISRDNRKEQIIFLNKRNIKISLVKRLGSNPVNILISCSLNTSP